MSIRYRRNPNIEGSPMLEETILLNPSSKQFCVLNETSTLLWNSLSTPSTVEELAAEVCGSFDGVDLATATADVERVLEEFQRLDLIAESS
ncbi:MAG: PqqD family protein [Gemmatimonadales bacterium]|nr:MAG: PqqD family protein [Gemmatimonadales bacterium]